MDLDGIVSTVIKSARLPMEEFKVSKHWQTIFPIWIQVWKEAPKSNHWLWILLFHLSMTFYTIEKDCLESMSRWISKMKHIELFEYNIHKLIVKTSTYLIYNQGKWNTDHLMINIWLEHDYKTTRISFHWWYLIFPS